jgi:hypothetical protein
VAVVCAGSLGRLAVLAVGARTVRGSGPDGPQPSGRSGAFPVRSPDDLSSVWTIRDGAGSSSSPRRT